MILVSTISLLSSNLPLPPPHLTRMSSATIVMKHKPAKAATQPKAPNQLTVAVEVKSCLTGLTQPALPQAPIPIPKHPIVTVKCTIVPVTNANGPAKPPTAKRLTGEVATQPKLPKVNIGWVMLLEGKDRCEWCQKLGFSSCQLHSGAVAQLRQWAKLVPPL